MRAEFVQSSTTPSAGPSPTITYALGAPTRAQRLGGAAVFFTFAVAFVGLALLFLDRFLSPPLALGGLLVAAVGARWSAPDIATLRFEGGSLILERSRWMRSPETRTLPAESIAQVAVVLDHRPVKGGSVAGYFVRLVLQRGEAVPLLPGLDVHGVGSGELAYHLGVATELRDALRMRGAKTELLQTKK